MPKHRVLMLDDSELTLEIQVMMLERKGYEVRACLDLAEVEQSRSDFEPDAILTDVSLGDVTVEEACRALREAFGEHVPILLFSGREDDELEQLAATLDVDGWISKSDSQNEIADQLAAVIRLATS